MKGFERIGERLRIRRAMLEDAKATYRWFSDPGVTEFLPLAGERILPIEDIHEFLSQACREDDPNLSVGVELRSGRLIGCGGLRNISIANSAEISVVIGERDCWGLGYGSEAMRMLLDEGFNELGLQNIWLVVREENARAVRCFSRLGFEVADKIEAAIVVKGVPRNKLRMELDASAWHRIAVMANNSLQLP